MKQQAPDNGAELQAPEQPTMSEPANRSAKAWAVGACKATGSSCIGPCRRWAPTFGCRTLPTYGTGAVIA